MPGKKKPRKKFIENKRARFDYQKVDELEVGMVLTGDEIKAIRKGHMQIAGSYGRILQGPKQPELWLVGATVAKAEGDKQRSIKLLAHRAQIARFIGLIGQKGFTLVPMKVYMKDNRAKLLLTLARGQKEYEKRSKLREKDMDRDISRTLRDKS